MKKLMIAGVAALSAAVSFAAIESANVVGYDSIGLRESGTAKGVGASFITVNAKKMTLGDLKVIGYDSEEGYGDFAVFAKKLDGYGRGGIAYYWCDFEEEGETYYGWFDGDMNDYNNVEVEAGEGLWVYSPSTAFSIQSAGQVSATDISVALRENGTAKMVANPMPVKLTLGDITVSGYDPEDGYGDFAVFAKKLDGYGRGGIAYYWCDFEEEGETYYGWFDGDMNDYNNVEVEAGEGLWVYSPSTTFSLVFPTPLAK